MDDDPLLLAERVAGFVVWLALIVLVLIVVAIVVVWLWL